MPSSVENVGFLNVGSALLKFKMKLAALPVKELQTESFIHQV
jgi:hypothetical protein